MSLTAQILTIGTEITSGEVINSNAAWIATRLEDLGVRVLCHLTVRDQKDEMRKALTTLSQAKGDILIVTGGLGPTSDDITREMVAEHIGATLEFNEAVWRDLEKLYQERSLPLREAHRHQCWFPKGSTRLNNPVGTAHGFYAHKKMHIFVLPGPPRELEGMWREEVNPRLEKIVPRSELTWHRWTFFAIPESEVAEIVEKVIAGSGLEVGYRAQVPYVRVKLFAHPEKHRSVLAEMDHCLAHALVGRDEADLAEILLARWPDETLKIHDEVSDAVLSQRLFYMRRKLLGEGRKVPAIYSASGPYGDEPHLRLLLSGEKFAFELKAGAIHHSETRALPYKIPLDSERGRRSAAEWALWLAVQAIRPH